MNVTHFDPYFYIPCPRGFTSTDLEPFKIYLNVRLCNPPLVLKLSHSHRKFRGVTTLHEQNLQKSRAFGVSREILP